MAVRHFASSQLVILYKTKNCVLNAVFLFLGIGLNRYSFLGRFLRDTLDSSPLSNR
ncbi:Uncharacterised protein [Shewanella morhuae]|uniref:Uncharacterized protein n=1 Tax=Shewanella morhuae TaxID=365591 RepID=A0A379ZEA0_9GAMM|nr:Uncharacterised protein [Shewanella morhuae]